MSLGDIEVFISITEAGSNAQVASFQIDNENNFVNFTYQVARVTDLRLGATGKGYFLV